MTQKLRALTSSDMLRAVQVVEISSRVAAAYCGKLLVQLGASVTRFGPPVNAVVSSSLRERMHDYLHAGKMDAGIDQNRLVEMLENADLLILEADSTDPAIREVVRKLEAGLFALKPDVKTTRIAATTADGEPMAGLGLTSGAWAGMSIAIGSPGKAPLSLPYDIADYELGVSAAAAALASLLVPASDALDPVDVAGRDVLAYFVGQLTPNYVPFGRPWRREGKRPSMSGGVYPCGLFPSRDGLVAIYCRSDKEWRGVLAAMGSPDWSKDPKFQDPRIVARLHAEEADGHLNAWLAQYSREALTALGQEHDFPIAPVRNVGEVLEDRQFAHRRALARMSDAPESPVAPVKPWRLFAREGPDEPTAKPACANDSRQRTDPSQILKGMRVLDFSWVWSGPMVTAILADLGAEVIKIENPDRLDSLRMRGRPSEVRTAKGAPDIEVNPWFNQLNHGKKSVVLDIKSAEGRAQVIELARTCDIVVENMRPGSLDKLELGYDALSQANPTIVMLSMSMAGQTGPLSQSKGYAGIMSALAGLEGLVGYPGNSGADDITGMTMTALGDPNAAMHGLAVLFAALRYRKQAGHGLWIDLAQTDAVLSIMGGPVLEAQAKGGVPVLGNRHPAIAPHGHYPCSGEDQWIAIAAPDGRSWDLLVEMAGPHLQPFARLDAKARLENVAAVDAAMAAWTSLQPRDMLVDRLLAKVIPAAPVLTYEEMHAAQWLEERQLLADVEHEFLGQQELYLPPWHFGGKVPVALAPAPQLGADTAAVLDAISQKEQS